MLHTENANLTHKDLNTRIHEPENRWIIELVLYDTSTLRAKPSSNGQLSYCSWSFGIVDGSHQYTTKDSVGWHTAMKGRIGFKLHVTTTLGLNSLYDRCYQMTWPFSGAAEDPEGDVVMEMHGTTEALYSAVISSTHAIRTEDEKPQEHVAHRMMHITKPWTIWSWSEWTVRIGTSFIQIAKETARLIDLEWTKHEQAQLMTLAGRYASRGISEALRVHRWWLASFSIILGDTQGIFMAFGQWYNGWPLDTWVDSPISHSWERQSCLCLSTNLQWIPKLTKMTHQERLSFWNMREMKMCSLVHPPQKVAWLYHLHDLVRHMKCSLTEHVADHGDISHMNAEMGNDRCTEIQLTFWDSQNPFVFVTTPKVPATGITLAGGNGAVITLMFWLLNQLWQAFAWVIWLGHSRVPHRWVLNMCPGGCDNCMSDLHQHSGVAHILVLHSVMCRLNITTLRIHRIPESCEDHSNQPMETGDTLPSDEPSS